MNIKTKKNKVGFLKYLYRYSKNSGAMPSIIIVVLIFLMIFTGVRTVIFLENYDTNIHHHLNKTEYFNETGTYNEHEIFIFEAFYHYGFICSFCIFFTYFIFIYPLKVWLRYRNDENIVQDKKGLIYFLSIFVAGRVSDIHYGNVDSLIVSSTLMIMTAFSVCTVIFCIASLTLKIVIGYLIGYLFIEIFNFYFSSVSISAYEDDYFISSKTAYISDIGIVIFVILALFLSLLYECFYYPYIKWKKEFSKEADIEYGDPHA